mgnify:CR=1 FL=1
MNTNDLKQKQQKSNIYQPVVIPSLHKCVADDNTKIDGHGIAIEDCWEDEKDRNLWVGNGEYANTVNYCPFCGYKGNVA